MSWLPECRVVPVLCSELIPIGECYQFTSLAELERFGIFRSHLGQIDFPCVFVHPDGDTSSDIMSPTVWAPPDDVEQAQCDDCGRMRNADLFRTCEECGAKQCGACDRFPCPRCYGGQSIRAMQLPSPEKYRVVSAVPDETPTVVIKGITCEGRRVTEVLELNGTTPVTTRHCYMSLGGYDSDEYPRIAGCCGEELTSEDDLCRCEAVEE